MSQHPDELPIPDAAFNGDSVEVVRAWICEGGAVHSALCVGMWRNDPNLSEDQAWSRIFSELIEMAGSGFTEDDEERREFIEAVVNGIVALTDPARFHDGYFLDEEEE